MTTLNIIPPNSIHFPEIFVISFFLELNSISFYMYQIFIIYSFADRDVSWFYSLAEENKAAVTTGA